jgi:hypothetical protein
LPPTWNTASPVWRLLTLKSFPQTEIISSTRRESVAVCWHIAVKTPTGCGAGGGSTISTYAIVEKWYWLLGDFFKLNATLQTCFIEEPCCGVALMHTNLPTESTALLGPDGSVTP